MLNDRWNAVNLREVEQVWTNTARSPGNIVLVTSKSVRDIVFIMPYKELVSLSDWMASKENLSGAAMQGGAHWTVA